jgi:cytochrome c oxidase cbb3-type subunit III
MSFFAKDHLSDHEYDGIREFDNPTPGWWHTIFIASVLFSFMYFVYYHSNPGAETPQTILQARQVAENRKLFGAYGELKNEEATLLTLMSDQKMMDVGQAMFNTACSQCHESDGRGKNGVNLTDESFKNIRRLTDFYTVLTNGANAGAMPSWKAQYSENERILLSAYAASLRGKNIPGRAAEGEPIEPWPTKKTEDKK